MSIWVNGWQTIGPTTFIAHYQTDSPDNAMDVEEHLIQLFCDHEKNDNDAKDARGGVSDEFVNFVYVALWWADHVEFVVEDEP